MSLLTMTWEDVQAHYYRRFIWARRFVLAYDLLVVLPAFWLS